jgi:tetratricopeptide (TPR) repeat protein
MAYRVPSPILFVLLPWIGVATAGLSFVILINHVLDAVATQGPLRQAVGRIEWGVSLVVRAFIYYSLLLYANGKLDVGPSTDRLSEVRAVRAVRAPLGGVTPYGWLTVRSWEDPGKTIRLLLRPAERGTFWVGEPVVLELRRGALWIPWVAAIIEDRDRRNRAILEVAPQAAMAWRDLIRFNLERARWKRVVEPAQQYFGIYPGDRQFLIEVADTLDMAEQPAEEVEILAPIMDQATPDAYLFKVYGLALSRSGRKTDAVQWLRKAVELERSDFWAYYHLGHTLRDLGRVAEAIEAYERAQTLKPGYPEIESDLALLRKAVLPKPR